MVVIMQKKCLLSKIIVQIGIIGSFKFFINIIYLLFSRNLTFIYNLPKKHPN
jgi:hypothetical protein